MPSEAFDNIVALLSAAETSPDTDLADLRAGYALMGAMVPVDDSVDVEPGDLGGVAGDWLTPIAADEGRVVLYFHGGGYNIGSNESHRSMLTHLATRARTRVFTADYRLAPESPYPAAIDDALAAYEGLLAIGTDPARVVVAGDSAGGGLALALLVRLRDAGAPLPAGAVVLSPWTDLSCSSASITANDATDIMLGRTLLDHWAASYLAGAEAHRPDASPLHAELGGLPPILVQVGDTEVLLDDGARFAAKADAAGVDVTLEVEPDMFHVWAFFAGIVPESDAALDSAASWILARTPAR
jgi:monoterpene epsilon-lactone hydrolase